MPLSAHSRLTEQGTAVEQVDLYAFPNPAPFSHRLVEFGESEHFTMP